MEFKEIIKEYEKNTPKSKEMYAKAIKSIPGGIAANIKYFDPYPIFMDKGEGAYLTDVDGNKYVDYLLSYGPLMLGHGHPAVINAINEQLEEHGSLLYGTPHRLEYEMAEKIKSLYPSMEMIRYTNSGTEATLFSLRMAYAYTGKYKIGKFEGHYHGGYNQVLISVNPSLEEAGPIERPNPIPESAGIEPYQLENTIVLPFNDIEACTKILKEHQHEMAAVIMEPILTGYIPADQDFMNGLRKVTEELGILLIFDEVKTGFRAGLGGAQGYYGIKPDITTLGKVVGGGFPFGIIGGKKDILMKTAPKMSSDIFDISTSKKSTAKDVLFHSGTYNGHPMILRTGLAVIDVLEKEIDTIFKNTELLKSGLKEIFKEKGIAIQTVGIGSVFNILINEKENIRTYRDIQDSDFELRKKIDFALFEEGIFNKPLNRYSTSTAHDEKVIDFTLEAYKKVLNKIL